MVVVWEKAHAFYKKIPKLKKDKSVESWIEMFQ